MVSHGCTPTAFPVGDGRLRILFAPRNERGQSIPSTIDVAADDPTRVLEVGERPAMTLGKTGTFDDGGIMPCSVVPTDEGLRMYYVGWNASVSVPYRNAIGLALSTDGGRTFERMFEGPVVDRSRTEPYFTASPCAMRVGDGWRLWYASTVRFLEVEGRQEPVYVLKDATSDDGIVWQRPNRTVIAPRHAEEAIARPTVLADDNGYRMWFCHRGSRDFRDGADSYRIGYAASRDGVTWERRDEDAGLERPAEGFDARMQTYPNVVRNHDALFMFYNGDGFGREGIGLATWSA